MEGMMLVIATNFANRKNCHLNKFDTKESRSMRSSVVMFATILLVIGNGLQNTMAAPFDPAFEDYLTKVCSDRGSFQVGIILATFAVDSTLLVGQLVAYLCHRAQRAQAHAASNNAYSHFASLKKSTWIIDLAVLTP
jgi:hypothetical protein